MAINLGNKGDGKVKHPFAAVKKYQAKPITGTWIPIDSNFAGDEE